VGSDDLFGSLAVLHDAMVALYAMTAGFAASGITANLYRLLVKQSDSSGAKLAYFAVMVVAGPSVVFDKAARSWRTKACSGVAFWLAAAVCSYWSFAIGLFVLQVALTI
jgi:hypothetical protein